MSTQLSGETIEEREETATEEPLQKGSLELLIETRIQILQGKMTREEGRQALEEKYPILAVDNATSHVTD